MFIILWASVAVGVLDRRRPFNVDNIDHFVGYVCQHTRLFSGLNLNLNLKLKIVLNFCKNNN